MVISYFSSSKICSRAGPDPAAVVPTPCRAAVWTQKNGHGSSTPKKSDTTTTLRARITHKMSSQHNSTETRLTLDNFVLREVTAENDLDMGDYELKFISEIHAFRAFDLYESFFICFRCFSVVFRLFSGLPENIYWNTSSWIPVTSNSKPFRR